MASSKKTVQIYSRKTPQKTNSRCENTESWPSLATSLILIDAYKPNQKQRGRPKKDANSHNEKEVISIITGSEYHKNSILRVLRSLLSINSNQNKRYQFYPAYNFEEAIKADYYGVPKICRTRPTERRKTIAEIIPRLTTAVPLSQN